MQSFNIFPESCMDLPKYASCGYLRFRSSTFREITYNLLTENQKREFHEKAIRYLERETRRCRSCGFGYFTRQAGTGRIDRVSLISENHGFLIIRTLFPQSFSALFGVCITVFFSVSLLRSKYICCLRETKIYVYCWICMLYISVMYLT